MIPLQVEDPLIVNYHKAADCHSLCQMLKSAQRIYWLYCFIILGWHRGDHNILGPLLFMCSGSQQEGILSSPPSCGHSSREQLQRQISEPYLIRAIVEFAFRLDGLCLPEELPWRQSFCPNHSNLLYYSKTLRQLSALSQTHSTLGSISLSRATACLVMLISGHNMITRQRVELRLASKWKPLGNCGRETIS